MIEYAALLLAIPLGIALASITNDEKEIYTKSQYFPTFLWALAVASAIFFILNKQLALTTSFIFITMFVWNRA